MFWNVSLIPASTVVLSVCQCPPHFPIWPSRGLEGHLFSLGYPSTFGASQDTLSYTMTITTALKRALNDGISSGKFIDTQIILFSRRDSAGRVSKPKALYANSHVLKSVPYFDDRKPLSHSASCTYNDPSPGVLSGPFIESEDRDFSETINDGEIAEEYGYSSDSDLEDDWDFESPAQPRGNSHSLQPGALYGEYKENARVGKVIRIRDVAFITCVCPKSILLFF